MMDFWKIEISFDLKKLARFAGGKPTQQRNNAEALLLTICNRRGVILHIFFLYAKRRNSRVI